ncbi:MAG: hypothetical protein ACXVHL_35005 [Solirubrobacteraceae bacterium]
MKAAAAWIDHGEALLLAVNAGVFDGVPAMRNLLLLLVVGFIAFVLFAFAIVGLVGEALIVLSLAGFVARAISTGTHHRRRS